jgi:hypothetical protein
MNFENFFQDMGERPKGLTLERKDNEKGYEPGNCIWATRKAQANNRRCSRLIEFNGQIRTLKQWAEQTGIHWGTIVDRLNRGWTAEDALTKPIRQRPRGNGKLYTYKGQSKTLTDWANEIGVNLSALSARINGLGWSLEKALTCKTNPQSTAKD